MQLVLPTSRRLPKRERLLKGHDLFALLRLYRDRNTMANHESVRLVVRPRKDNENRRVAVLVPKKVAGRATHRNRLKRLLREVYRHNKDRFPEQSDILLAIGRHSYPATFEGMQDSVLKLL